MVTAVVDAPATVEVVVAPGPVGRTPATVVVSGLDAVTSSAVVATNLALSLAHAGYSVTLLDATLGRADPDVAGLLGLDVSPGLAESILDDDQRHPRVHTVHGLDVITAGEPSESARERLAGARLAAELDRLRGTTDFVIIAGPTMARSESLAVASHGAELILVVAERRDTHDALSAAVTQARQVKVDLVGLVVQPPRGRRGRSKSDHTPTPPTTPSDNDSSASSPSFFDRLSRDEDDQSDESTDGQDDDSDRASGPSAPDTDGDTPGRGPGKDPEPEDRDDADSSSRQPVGATSRPTTFTGRLAGQERSSAGVPSSLRKGSSVAGKARKPGSGSQASSHNSGHS